MATKLKRRKESRRIISGTKQFLKDVVGSADMPRKDVKEIGKVVIEKLK
jgi:hypothetical protein